MEEPQAKKPTFQDLSRSRTPQGFRGRNALTVLVWQMVQATLFAWSPQPLYAWRRALLRFFGAKIGKGVLLRPTSRITYPWKVRIGDHSWIGDRTELYSLGEIEIGNNVCISQRSYICAATHEYDKINFPLLAKPVKIEDEVWIATDCFIAPGVTIGKGSLIAARSVVVKSVGSGEIVAGTISSKIKTRSPSIDDAGL